MKKTNLFVIAVLLFIALPAYARSVSTEHIFYYFPNQKGYLSVEQNAEKIDILAPQIYTVGFDLKLGKAESEDILALAKKKKIDVMPLVVNAQFDKVLMTRILNDKDAQDEIIYNLIKEAKNRKYIGWQFDFENINHNDREAYVKFVEKTYKALKRRKLLFSVAVIPRTTDYNKFDWSQDWSSGYDISAISKSSDFISIMSYDDPTSQGPVASMTYVKKALAKTLETVPAKKISLGIPLYCWQWQTGKTKKIANVTYETAANTLLKYKQNGAASSYDKNHASELFEFIKDDGITNYLWCDNEQSVSTKITFSKEQKLRGVSYWAIGQEDKRIWNHLK